MNIYDLITAGIVGAITGPIGCAIAHYIRQFLKDDPLVPDYEGEQTCEIDGETVPHPTVLAWRAIREKAEQN